MSEPTHRAAPLPSLFNRKPRIAGLLGVLGRVGGGERVGGVGLLSLIACIGFFTSAGFVQAQEVSPAASVTADLEAAPPTTPGSNGELSGENLDVVSPDLNSPPPRFVAREAGLKRVLEAREQIEAELIERQQVLGSDSALGRENEIQAQIRALSEELASLNRSFSELASGVDPVSIETDQIEEKLNLSNEVRDLLGPLVNELKRATSRPREIDRLRTEISELGERLIEVDGALGRLDGMSESLENPALVAALDEERGDWSRRKSAIATSLQVAQQKLEQRLGESQSITQAIENIFQLFFKSRGRNLLLAVVAMIGFLLFIRRLRSFLAKRPLLSSRRESFEGRIVGLISSAFTVIGAVLVFLLSLYFFGDWVLLILVLLLILGLIWTSKQAIPRFWSQTVLILDMGAVREGERVIYNGLPWLVESISFYSTLVNPALVGGRLRLPIADLEDLRSRAHDESEPWFPTKPGDVVMTADGRPAKVDFQSIEGVHLQMPGGNRSVIPAAAFAGEAVEKLCGGYRVDIAFGLDYADQANITTTMLDTMERGVAERWRESRWAESLVSCAVEFREAGASSLDYFVRVDLDGTQALDVQAQKRALARFCVEVCNENRWVIPFTQLTVHMADAD